MCVFVCVCVYGGEAVGGGPSSYCVMNTAASCLCASGASFLDYAQENLYHTFLLSSHCLLLPVFAPPKLAHTQTKSTCTQQSPLMCIQQSDRTHHRLMMGRRLCGTLLRRMP